LVVTKTTSFWLEKMREAGIPCGEVRSVGAALNSPESIARGMVEEIPHSTAGSISLVMSPLKLSGTPVVRPKAPPLLGQHTDDVLSKSLGYDPAKIAALRAAGIVG
jgi:crotonobetainyl-CoA:carnitine CoA-transferase CaiB-like acyl-CoA transferase